MKRGLPFETKGVLKIRHCPIDFFNKLESKFIMISIKAFNKQEYEKIAKSPSEIIFYETEKDILKIISKYLAKNIEENIEVLQKFLPLPKGECYEIEYEKGLFFILKLD